MARAASRVSRAAMWNKIQSIWRRNKARYAEAVNRYGLPIILTAMALRLLMAASVLALYKLGFQFEALSDDALSAENAGLFVAAWALVWPLAPIRWGVAALIAPPIVRQVRKMRGLPPDLPPPEPEPEPEPE